MLLRELRRLRLRVEEIDRRLRELDAAEDAERVAALRRARLRVIKGGAAVAIAAVSGASWFATIPRRTSVALVSTLVVTTSAALVTPVHVEHPAPPPPATAPTVEVLPQQPVGPVRRVAPAAVTEEPDPPRVTTPPPTAEVTPSTGAAPSPSRVVESSPAPPPTTDSVATPTPARDTVEDRDEVSVEDGDAVSVEPSGEAQPEPTRRSRRPADRCEISPGLRPCPHRP